MRSLNKILLIGNVGKAPEIKHTTNGHVVAKFGLVTNRSFKKKGSEEWEEEATWHNLEMWDKLAEWAEKYVTKGTRLFVEGEVATSKWEDDAGNKRSRQFVKVFIPPIFVGGKKPDQDTAPAAGPYDEAPAYKPGKLTPAIGGNDVPPF
jgi:single-strand DNA-binding protein